MSQEELLNRLEAELRTLLEQTRSQFTRIDPNALTQRNTPESWNILECFAHLNLFYEDYLPRIELAIHKAKARRWAPGGDVKYTARGRRAIQRADPENGKSYKSPKTYNFSHKPIGPEVVKSFIINGERFLRILQAARAIDVNRAKVKKVRAWIGQYSVANLLEYLITHSRRHILQAQRLLPPAQ